MCVITVDIDFFKHGETDAEVDRTKVLDIGLGSGFLTAELIAGWKYLRSIRLIFTFRVELKIIINLRKPRITNP